MWDFCGDTLTYHYDINGNLTSIHSSNGLETPIDPTSYDDKVNFLRTDSLFMLLARNYSKNNPVMAVGYNSKGLPTGFPGSVSKALPFWFFDSPLITSIEYRCQ